MPCVQEEEAIGALLHLLSSSPVVVLGYCVGEQLSALLAATEGETRGQVAEAVQGLIDLRWLPRWQGRRVSLATIMEEEGMEGVALTETSNITTAIAGMILRGGKGVKEEMLGSTLTCTSYLLSILTVKDVLLTAGLRRVRRREGRAGSGQLHILVFVYVLMTESGTCVEVDVRNRREHTSLYSKKLALASRKEDVSGCINLLTLLGSQDDTSFTIITVCPESLAVFKQLWAEATDKPFLDTFSGWMCLASEAYVCQQPLIAVPMEATHLRRLAAAWRTASTKELPTTVMERVRSRMMASSKDMEEMGRSLRLEEDMITIFLEVEMESKEGPMPKLGTAVFTDSLGRGGRCGAGELLLHCLEVWPGLGQDRRLLLVTLDQDTLITALCLCRTSNPGVLNKMVAGVATITNLLGRLKGEAETWAGVQSFWASDIELLTEIHVSAMDVTERLEVARRCWQVMQKEPAVKDHLHPLLSPYVNRVMLDCGFNVFGEEILEMQVEVELGRLVGHLQRQFWNYDERRKKVMVQVKGQPPWWSTQLLRLKPDMTVGLGKDNTEKPPTKALAKVVYVAKNSKEDKQILATMVAEETREALRAKFSKGFDFFQDLFLKNPKTKGRNRLELCSSMVKGLSCLGFTSLQHMFDHLLASCQRSTSVEPARLTGGLVDHLRAVVSCVESPATVLAVLLPYLYTQLQQTQPDLPNLNQLRQDMFPAKWIIR